jgi:phosphate-selective porin OprO/OprP
MNSFNYNRIIIALSLTGAALALPTMVLANDSQEIEQLEERIKKLEKSAKDLKVKWKGAPSLSSDSGSQFKIRGRLMFDTWTTSGSNDDAANITGTEVRRARIGVEGKVSSDFKYKFEMDFSGNNANFSDAYIQYKGWKNSTLTVGNVSSDYSINGKGSSRFTDMIERAVVVNGFYPNGGGRSLGIVYSTGGSNWHISGELGGDGTKNSGNSNDSTRLVSRAHYAPILNNDQSLHLGGWVYNESYSGDPTVAVKTRLGNHFNDVSRVKSGAIDNAKGATAYGLEVASVNGAFSVVAEYMSKSYEDNNNLDPTYSGYYVTAGYFLTGESKNYSGKSGLFGRVKPNSPVTNGGIGAWQIVARIDDADYNDESLEGGEATVYTVGLNWSPTAYTRVMLNYVDFDLSGAQNDSGNSLGLRVQVDW